MTAVTITKDLAAHKAGDTINVTPGVAAYLIGAGIAEEAKAPRKSAAKAKTDDSASD